jgi:hypothetical protein
MRRIIGILLAAAVALTAVAGCGRLRDRGDDTTELSWDEQALQSIGYETADLAPASSDDDTGGRGGRHPRLRYLFQHALHAEATVQTEKGLVTVVAQRGTVTEVTDATVTIRSTDDFTLTWRLGDRSVVVVDRAKSELSKVTVGTEVGVAGSRDGDTVTVRLLVVPRS